MTPDDDARALRCATGDSPGVRVSAEKADVTPQSAEGGSGHTSVGADAQSRPGAPHEARSAIRGAMPTDRECFCGSRVALLTDSTWLCGGCGTLLTIQLPDKGSEAA